MDRIGPSLDEHLIALEGELLTATARSDRERLAVLLHDDFFEIGRSGRQWTRADVVANLPAERLRTITMREARVERITQNVAQVLYVSHDAATDRLTRRSSVWVLQGGAWKMRFHQGTDL